MESGGKNEGSLVEIRQFTLIKASECADAPLQSSCSARAPHRQFARASFSMALALLVLVLVLSPVLLQY
jgi:hypothetical protein